MTNAIPLQQIGVKIRTFEKSTIGNVVAIGRLLHEAREQCEHGEYQEWLNCEFAWSYRTCLRYSHACTFAEKCQPGTFEKLNLSLGALHIAADPATSDAERAAIIKAAQEGRVTASIAEDIVDELRHVDSEDDAGQDPDPVDGDDGDDPKDAAPDHEDADDVEDDIGDGNPENCRTAFMLRADLSITAAKDAKQLIANYKSYARIPDEEFVRLVDHVLQAWNELRGELSAGHGPVKSAADRAEARSREQQVHK
jgi:hypothetical protein